MCMLCVGDRKKYECGMGDSVNGTMMPYTILFIIKCKNEI